MNKELVNDFESALQSRRILRKQILKFIRSNVDIINDGWIKSKVARNYMHDISDDKALRCAKFIANNMEKK